jgi:hypothetical protein
VIGKNWTLLAQAVVLGGCGGSQPAIGAPGVKPYG